MQHIDAIIELHRVHGAVGICSKVINDLQNARATKTAEVLVIAPRGESEQLLSLAGQGSTQGWFVSAGPVNTIPLAPPVNIPSGGPAGVGDNYLLLTALGGTGSGSRLSVLNGSSQWRGNYLAAGISAITMEVNNLGATDLYLRLLFEDPMMGPPQNEAFTTNPVILSAGSGWTSITFLIDPGSLTAGSGSVNAALTNTTLIRIFHSPAAGFPGPPVVAQLGVDNIRTTAVPEPTTLLLLGTSLAGVGAAVRKAAHRKR